MESEEIKAGKDEEQGGGFKFKCINETKETIEDEIRALCKEWYIEAKYFLKYAITSESRLFYMKILKQEEQIMDKCALLDVFYRNTWKT